MAIRTGVAAINWAKSLVGKYIYSGLCLKFVRLCFNVPAKYPSAQQAWLATKYRHGGTPPPGVPVWWTGGANGYGHVAISVGNGYVISTDAPTRGKVGRVPISWFAKNWPRHTYRGWSADINGVLVWKPSSTSLPSVSLSKIRAAAKAGSYYQPTLYVQRSLKKQYTTFDYSSGPGWFGKLTKYHYGRWQKALGYTGSNADGIPGFTSLYRLGKKFGLFKVVS